MDRKEKVLLYISSSAYVPLKFDELAIVLDVPKSDVQELEDIIKSLISEGKIYLTKRNRIMPCNAQSNKFSGVLQCNARGGFGFVRCFDTAEDDIFIANESMGSAYDGDSVIVSVDRGGDNGMRREGHIIGIISRGNETLVGVVTNQKGGYYRVVPDRREFFASIRVKPDDLSGAKPNDRVVVRITEYSSKNKPHARVEAILGDADDVSSVLNGFIADSGIQTKFPKAVLIEADDLPDKVSTSDLEGREDLRDKLIFTIDGDDSRDFDDAVSLESLPDGNRLLGVHIADVTHYVKDSSELDNEALKRATSIYFPHRVIPMLPKRLSNGICSLNPDVDRLTLSVFMEIDSDGNIHDNRIVRSVIHSKARMTYNNVNKILNGDTKLCEEYHELVEVLKDMSKLSDVLAKKREERGAIDFDFPEAKVICDENSEPVEVKVVERGKSQRLIESFMLAANETVAQTAYWAELPFVYRVHESPSIEKLTTFNDFIKNFNLSLKGKLDPENIHPKDLQTIADKVKGKPEEMMVSKEMLRSLMKACYRDTNDGHFGLAARFYCHFTSPIRRYPDLIIHRVLKEFIDGKLTEQRQLFYEPKVSYAAQVSSEREVIAENTERDAVDLLKTAYMSRFIGESFDAVISSVTSFGMFATLENSCEGLIRCETMQGDYFEYDENAHILSGKRSGRTYRIGDTVRITVAACNVIMRSIDFVLEQDARPEVFARIEKRSKNAMARSEERKIKGRKVTHRRKKR